MKPVCKLPIADAVCRSAPRPRFGIIGGGQLAKMLAAAAAQLGCEIAILERNEDFPARLLARHVVIGDWDDPERVLQLAALADVLTLENEFVSPVALTAVEQRGTQVRPRGATLQQVRDKWQQKMIFADAGLPVVRFAKASHPSAVESFGIPAVLKKRVHSYDGKGNATVYRAEDLLAVWKQLEGERYPLYVEALCPFVRELAIIVTRGADGRVVRYPVMETINRDHICHIVRGPIEHPDVAELAEKAVTAIDGVGSFGLEFFELADGRVLLNEIAPRVHNTGHYTIEACECSQFENHVRAVFGWPLGSPKLRAPAAAMVNLLGQADGPGTPYGLEEALKVPGAHIHIYGKTRSARGRKMGHVTALGETVDEALRCAQTAAQCIRFGDKT